MENQLLQSAILRKARRDRGKDDVEFFCNYYFPHIIENKTPEFHKEIFNFLLSENRLVIAAPRGFAKSTIVQLLYGMYCLLYNQGEDILTISQSASLAEDWVRKIRMEFENNERVKNDFWGLLQWGEKDSRRWTTNHLVIQKENMIFSQVRARGRGCQVRGLRPTKVVCDDLEEEEGVRSQEQRKFLKEWFLGALLNVLKTDQQLVVIGTILHPLALLNEIIERKEQFKEWTSKKYKALIVGENTNDYKSLWADRFPVEDLLKRKSEIGTYAFEAEFQNNPISSDICLWKPEWIKKYQDSPKVVRKFVALDPAISTKESADYSALTCIGETEDGNVYELESIKGRWGTWDLIDHCIKFYQKHQPLRFGIEEVAFQSVLRDLLIREGRKTGVRLPVEPLSLGVYTGKEKSVKQPKDKFTRALSIIHFFEQGYVYLKTQDLIDQLVVFPTGDEDDLVDSMVYAIMLLKKYSPVKVMVSSEKKKDVIQGFVITKETMPCLAPPIEETFKKTNSWRIGG